MKRLAVAATLVLIAIAPAAQAQGLEMFGTYSGDGDRFDGAYLAFALSGEGVHDLAFDDAPMVAAIDVDLDPDGVSVDGARVTAAGPNATVVLHDTPTGFVKVRADAPVDVTLRVVDAADLSVEEGVATVRRGAAASVWVPGGAVALDDGNLTASLDADQRLMFRVRPGGSFPAMSAYEPRISGAVESGHVGAEAFVQGQPRPASAVATYAPMEVAVESGDAVTLTVDAGQPDGRVIVARVDDLALAGDGPIRVLFDGEPIGEADGIADVLDPDDDGLDPEYLHARVAGSHVVLTSVPHFSLHEVTIDRVAEIVRENPEIAAVTVAGAGAVVALAAGGMFAPRRDGRRNP